MKRFKIVSGITVFILFIIVIIYPECLYAVAEKIQDKDSIERYLFTTLFGALVVTPVGYGIKKWLDRSSSIRKKEMRNYFSELKVDMRETLFDVQNEKNQELDKRMSSFREELGEMRLYMKDKIEEVRENIQDIKQMQHKHGDSISVVSAKLDRQDELKHRRQGYEDRFHQQWEAHKMKFNFNCDLEAVAKDAFFIWTDFVMKVHRSQVETGREKEFVDNINVRAQTVAEQMVQRYRATLEDDFVDILITNTNKIGEIFWENVYRIFLKDSILNGKFCDFQNYALMFAKDVLDVLLLEWQKRELPPIKKKIIYVADVDKKVDDVKKKGEELCKKKSS